MKIAAAARRLVIGVAGLVAALAAAIVGLGYLLSTSTWRGPKSDHFDGSAVPRCWCPPVWTRGLDEELR